MARGAADRGKRIAFGDDHRIIWDQHSETIFRDNPNIMPKDARSFSNAEWIPFYRGNRIYNRQGPHGWIWNYDFRAIPGQIFLSREERRFAERAGKGFVLMEPNVPAFKSASPNKQWPVERYNEVASLLKRAGRTVVQLSHRGSTHRLRDAVLIETPDFRRALAVLARAALYIGPEGGLHHGAAAVGVPGVVLFGGFIPPQVTGYTTHTNLTGGAEACGRTNPCVHCKAAMAAISVEEVLAAACEHLTGAIAA